MTRADGIESALRQDRIIVLAALGALAAVAWLYMIREARAMGVSGVCHCAGMAISGPDVKPWAAGAILPLFLMWAGMMVAMMTPAAAPVALLYARILPAGARAFGPAAWFSCGYLCAWTLFACGAALAQWGLEALALVTPMMAGASRRFGGAVLIAAGAYQWLPLKDACLAQCRAPLSVLQRLGGFQAGAAAALRLGIRHGLYCVGCCWLLMTLLFVVGVMNLLWIAALMGYVLLERLLPGGRTLARVTGAAAVLIGLWMNLR
jgi:predicted metal-binding membrane protein